MCMERDGLMRVIAGKAKRLQLKSPSGYDTIPTTDKIKETLFNIINPYLADTDFLDLFSGSGAIGIEALSRGVKSVAFVENDKAYLECIKSNLNYTKLDSGAEIYPMGVKEAIRALEVKGKVFDFVYMDPPYNGMLERDILLRLQLSNIIYCDTVIIVKTSRQIDFEYLKDTKLKISRIKEYKSSQHVFIEMA